MPLVTLPDHDDPVEVSFDQIDFDDESPPGFVTTDHLSSEVQRRVGSAKRNARETLKSDDEFFAEVAEHRGYEVMEDDDGPRIKGSSRDLQKQQERFRAQHVEPLEKKLSEKNETIERYRRKALEANVISAAADLRVKKGLMKPVAEGTPAPIVQMVRDAFDFDAETDAWGLKDGDTFRYNDDGELAGAETLLDEWRSDPDYADIFEDTRMKDSGYQGDDGSSEGRIYTRAEFDKLCADPEYFAEHEQELTKAWDEGRVQ